MIKIKELEHGCVTTYSDHNYLVIMVVMEQFGDETVNNKRHRAWVFTINNYTDDDTDAVYALSQECQFCSVGKEVGDGGTPHYQGFVMFATLKAFAQVKELLVRAWIAPKAKRSTFTQAIAYTHKDNDYYEHGDPPIDPVAKGELQKDRAVRNLQAIMDKRYEDVDADVLVTQLRNYEYAAQRLKTARDGAAAPLDGVLDNMWVHGAAGVGKDTFVNTLAPRAFIKEPDTKWWDGYDGDDDVTIRDLGPDHDPRVVKVWADRYPFQAEVKGSSLGMIRPKRIFVTSNYSPEDLYEGADLDAVERRFQVVHAHNGVAEFKKRRLTEQPAPLVPVCYDIAAAVRRGNQAAANTNIHGFVWTPQAPPYNDILAQDPCDQEPSDQLPSDQESEGNSPRPL